MAAWPRNWSPKSVNDIYAFPLDLWIGSWYNGGMEDMIQTLCEACEQVLTFPATEDSPRYCSVCSDEFDEMLRVDLKDEEIDAWADFWEAKEKACIPPGWENAPPSALAAWAVAGDDGDLFDQIKAELQGE